MLLFLVTTVLQVRQIGDKTGSVEKVTHYLTVHLVSVILAEINRVVVVVGMESVVTLKNIVVVTVVQTTQFYIESGENQMVQ